MSRSTTILVVDANVLVRMVVGRRAAGNAERAVRGGLELMTTVRQLDEASGVLGDVFKLAPDDVLRELLAVADMMSVTDEEAYGAYRQEAVSRLRWKAEGDWPVLATALAFDAAVWTDNRDFFGTGVAVWSSNNIDRVGSVDPTAGSFLNA